MDAATSLSTARAVFDERIATREARLGIVGLGYAGLPLGILFADAGFHVTGIDVDEQRVTWVNERQPYLVDVPRDRYDAAVGSPARLLAAVGLYAADQEVAARDAWLRWVDEE